MIRFPAIFLVCISISFTLHARQVNSEALAFPGAMGYGKNASGGRGGKVLIVQNLNDSGPGSLREAVEQAGARIITFAVSGTIQLKSALEISEGAITIAGQSAPGDGITIRDFPVRIKANNVIIRYMRFRMGDETAQEDDAINGTRNERIIIDHCSVSWGTDECASFYYNRNFSMQWCIISEGLNASVHTKGEHGYGGIWGGMGASFQYNLIASHKSRMPRFSGSATVPNQEDELLEFYNNVIYNWRDNNIYGGENGRYNVINNYFKPGPATISSASGHILDPSEPYGLFYLSGNILEDNIRITKHNKYGLKNTKAQEALVEHAFDTPLDGLSEAESAYRKVVAFAGACLSRDAVDARILTMIISNEAVSGMPPTGIINTQTEVGGWPALQFTRVLADSDKDGIPDEWELVHGLDPESPDDACLFTLDPYYSNIEVYLNGLVP